MNLLFIYGPPATGKFTIAKEVAKLTGYKLFHNHLSLDLAREILPDFDDKLFDLTYKIRLDVFEAAAKYDRNLLFTNVYSGSDMEINFVKRVVAMVKGYGGNVLFVQLTAPLDVILSRVEDESRKQYKKIGDKEKLRTSLEKYDMNVSVPYDTVLTIDTSKFSSEESAKKIVDSLALNI